MTLETGRSGRDEWRRHWSVIPAGLMGLSLGTLHNYSFGVMIGPLERSFGWSRAEISTGPLIISCIAIVVAPLVGLGVDRFGPRRVALVGVPLYCAALTALSAMTGSAGSWVLHWTLIGLATMFVLPSVWTAAVNTLFDKTRGLALATVLCGTGLSGALVPALTSSLIDTYGWRGAYPRLALIAFVVVMPAVVFLFRGATDRQRRQPDITSAPISGVSGRAGLRSASFLLICAAAVIFTLPSCALTTNGVPVLIAQGLDPITAASIAGFIGVGSIFGRLCGGVLLDRLEAKKVAAASVLLPIVAIAIFLVAPGQASLAALACFTLGLSVGTEYDACSYLAARHFGMRSFGTLFGAITGLLLLGNGIAPLLANFGYDLTGSYDVMLWSAIPLCGLSAVLFLMLPGYPSSDADTRVEAFDAGSITAAPSPAKSPTRRLCDRSAFRKKLWE